MATAISEKKAFLCWLISEYQFKNRESGYLLKYMSKKDSILQIIHFVDDASHCPRAMMVSTEDIEGEPFIYKKDHLFTYEAEKAFHDIRMDRDEPIYIQMNLPNRNRKIEYAAVVEENPFFQPDLSDKYGDDAQHILDQVSLDYQISKLEKEINLSLDTGDKEKFINLSQQLKKLMKDSYK